MERPDCHTSPSLRPSTEAPCRSGRAELDPPVEPGARPTAPAARLGDEEQPEAPAVEPRHPPPVTAPATAPSAPLLLPPAAASDSPSLASAEPLPFASDSPSLASAEPPPAAAAGLPSDPACPIEPRAWSWSQLCQLSASWVACSTSSRARSAVARLRRGWRSPRPPTAREPRPLCEAPAASTSTPPAKPGAVSVGSKAGSVTSGRSSAPDMEPGDAAVIPG
mmetsp:Transcript_9729/g.37853  ORF Transcript_9729/g.37853 Transcript_9729/m.37853 type:complete len:222 (+) Transcript_9729:1621-2286(+)